MFIPYVKITYRSGHSETVPLEAIGSALEPWRENSTADNLIDAIRRGRSPEPYASRLGLRVEVYTL